MNIENEIRDYLVCALWTATDDNGNNLDDQYEIDAFDEKARAEARETVTDFIAAIEQEGLEYPAQGVGHDLWLTRNHHGAGFWDRGYGDLGKRLTELAHGFGEAYVYESDNGELGIA